MKELRQKQFEELQEIYSLFDLNWQKALVIDPGQIRKIKSSSTGTISFVEGNIVNCIPEKSLVLVFASAKNPGGGIKNGARAQEEDISLHTSWYYHIRDVEGFYLDKGENAINTDKMLYVKHAHLIKDICHNDIEPISISLLGATAPNINGMKNQGHSIKKVYGIMANRVENIFKFAQITGHKNFILGAWGCGVFGLDSEKVADIFKEKIDMNIYSGDITFCIMDKKILEIFQKKISPNHKLKLR